MVKFLEKLRPKSLLAQERDRDVQQLQHAVTRVVRLSAQSSPNEDLKKAASIALKLEDYQDAGKLRITDAIAEAEKLITAIYRKYQTPGWQIQSASTPEKQKTALFKISYTLQNLCDIAMDEKTPSRKSRCRDVSQKLYLECEDARIILGVPSITPSDLQGLLEFLAFEEQACGSRDQKQTVVKPCAVTGAWVEPEPSSQPTQVFASPGVESQSVLEITNTGTFQPLWSAQSLLPSSPNMVSQPSHSLHSPETTPFQEKPLLSEPVSMPTPFVAVASNSSPQLSEPTKPAQSFADVDTKPRALEPDKLASRAVEDAYVSAPDSLRRAASFVRTLTSLNKQMSNGKVIQLPVISKEAEQGFAHIYHIYLLSNEEERCAWPGKEREVAWSQFAATLEDLVNATMRFSELHRPSKVEIRPLQLKAIQSRDAMKKAANTFMSPDSDIWADLDRLLKEEEGYISQSNISQSNPNSIPKPHGFASSTPNSVPLQAPANRQDSLSQFFEGSHGSQFEDVQIAGRDSHTVHDKYGWAARNGVMEHLHHVHETVDDRQTAYGRFFAGSTGNTFRGGSISGRDSITIRYG